MPRDRVPEPITVPGWSAIVTLDATHITLARTGWRRWVTLGKPTRRVALTAVEGFDWGNASRVTNGHLRLIVRGLPAADDYVNRGNDPHTVFFTRAQEPEFSALRERLLSLGVPERLQVLR